MRVWGHGGLPRLSSFSGFSPGDEVSVGLAHIALRIRNFSNDDGEGDRDDDGDEDVKKTIGLLNPLSRFVEDVNKRRISSFSF